MKSITSSANDSTTIAGKRLTTPTGTPTRIMPTELLHEFLDGNTVRTQYKAGYCYFMVTSNFTGDRLLSDALFGILEKT